MYFTRIPFISGKVNLIGVGYLCQGGNKQGMLEKQGTQRFLLAELFSKETPSRNELISGFCFPVQII